MILSNCTKTYTCCLEMLIILSIFSQLSRSMKSHVNRNFDINRLKCLPSFRCLCFVSMSWTITAWAIGIIIAVVAVLLTHMDRKHVINMKPSINLQWLRRVSWTDLFIQKHVKDKKAINMNFFHVVFYANWTHRYKTEHF